MTVPPAAATGHDVGSAGRADVGRVLAVRLLGPLGAFTDGGALTPDQAAGAVVNGTTGQMGNGIDEFVIDTLRNELLGLPLDLPTINMMRGRDTGIPPLQEARAAFFAETGDPLLEPYESWTDFGLGLKHPESLVNLVATYGTHPSITVESSIAGKRTAAQALLAGTLDPGDISIVPGIVTTDVAPRTSTRPSSPVHAPTYDVIQVSETAMTVVHARGTLVDGTDTLRNVERVKFADQRRCCSVRSATSPWRKAWSWRSRRRRPAGTSPGPRERARSA